MSIAELIKLVPHPSQPFEVGSIERWREIEAELGTALPTDYRDFVFAYGSGLFAGLYVVDNPFSTNEYVGIIPASRSAADILRDLRETEGEGYVPFPIFPEPGGLLHWGNDENGHCYYWLTEGPPDEWIVVQDDVRGSSFAEQPEQPSTMTEFLVGVLTGKIIPLASDYPDENCFVFKPFGP